MTTSHHTFPRSFFLALVLSLGAGCATRPPPTPIDATTDAMAQTGPRTFTLALLADDLEVVRGERITFEVRIERRGGFDEPVLVELAGLPDGLTTLSRESRPGDAQTTITIVANEDGEPIESAAFVVQATSLDGLRQIAPAHITVR
jgi:hypothetical protein